MTTSGLNVCFYDMPFDEAESWIAGYAAHFSKTGMVRKSVVDASKPLDVFDPPDPMAVGKPSNAEVSSIFGDVSAIRDADPANGIVSEMVDQMQTLLTQLSSGAPPPELVIRAIEPSISSDLTLVEMSYGEENLDFDAIGRLSGAAFHRFHESYEVGSLQQRFFTIRSAGDVVRSLGLTREGSSLSFIAEGKVQPWEETDAYRKASPDERLTRELFDRYLTDLGLDVDAVINRRFSRISEYRETVELPKALDTRATSLEFHVLFQDAVRLK